METKYTYYILGVLISIIIIGFLIWMTVLSVITITALLVTLLILFVAIGIPIILRVIYIRLKGRTHEDDATVKKLDATTVIPWVTKLMREQFATEIEIISRRITHTGMSSDRTPICYIKLFGVTSKEYYHVLVNLLEPDALNSVLKGIYSDEQVDLEMEKLSYTPAKIPRRIIKRQSPEGYLTETEEDINPPNVEEEIIDETRSPAKWREN